MRRSVILSLLLTLAASVCVFAQTEAAPRRVVFAAALPSLELRVIFAEYVMNHGSSCALDPDSKCGLISAGEVLPAVS